MRQRTTIGIFALLLLIGCAHERRQAPLPAPPAAPPGAQGAPQESPPTPPPSAPLPAATAGTEAGTRTTEAARGAASTAAPSSRAGATGSAGASADANAKAKSPPRAESAAAAGGAPRTVAPAGAASAGTAGAGAVQARPTPPSAPTLDLTSLEQRLKDTRAIGLFTKLSLKNQVDDLLGEFRTFHSGNRTLTLAALRQKYDLLLLKVLSLLQDGDPSLASAISASREAIWGILIDPQKFEKLASN